MKLQASVCNFIKKEALAQVFSCEFCEISTNTFSYKIPPATASVSQKWNAKAFWDPVKHLKYSFPQKWLAAQKNSILDAWRGSEMHI